MVYGRKMENAAKKPLYIIVGLSGAGKSTALRVFEDHHYFAVDGLPPGVVPAAAAIMDSAEMGHFAGLAIGLDNRQRDFHDGFKNALETLASRGITPKILFFEADNQNLVHRYAATRRPHPLENPAAGLEAAIHVERKLLEGIRENADLIINSSGMNIHDLRRHLSQNVLATERRRLTVNILSFGFKNGLPADADFVFDLRFISNPYFVEILREKSGLDKEVAEYVFTSPQATRYATLLEKLLAFALAAMEQEGRYRVTIAFGCTGGRHRSVAFAVLLGRHLAQLNYTVSVSHRDIEKS